MYGTGTHNHNLHPQYHIKMAHKFAHFFHTLITFGLIAVVVVVVFWHGQARWNKNGLISFELFDDFVQEATKHTVLHVRWLIVWLKIMTRFYETV